VADPIHVHSQFDPEQRAIALVEEIEREALDEDMVASSLQRMMAVFQSRIGRSEQIINEERAAAVKEKRSDRLRERKKGVEPQRPGGPKVQLVPPHALAAGTH
jgi:hypothetical protein